MVVTARVSSGSDDAGPPGFSPRRPETLDAGFGILGGLPRPLYPERARRLRRGGSVVLDILVGPDGKVMRVVVVRESLGWGFGAAAREAYAKAVFTPPRANGRPVRVLWRKTLRFRP
ncbi:MAG: energy transducer TonB [bacterium]